MRTFEHFDIHLLKAGKASKHLTKSGGKSYLKAKIYLKDASLAGKNYELYDLGDAGIKEMFGTVTGKAMLLFIPSSQRTKKKIGRFGEHRLGNRYLSRMKFD